MQAKKPGEDKIVKRYARVERDEVSGVHEDENQHLWAVSYSDFLMALLAFFILFFSTETPERQKLILELAGQFKGSGGVQTTTAPSGNPIANGKARVPASVLEALRGLEVSV
ncbi:MAG: hypothetical protein EOP09_19695, partial [Proteobacteria bacterium]